jgi:hypothetical protein
MENLRTQNNVFMNAPSGNAIGNTLRSIQRWNEQLFGNKEKIFRTVEVQYRRVSLLDCACFES